VKTKCGPGVSILCSWPVLATANESVRPSVCLSVCLSHPAVLSKWHKLGSRSLHCQAQRMTLRPRSVNVSFCVVRSVKVFCRFERGSDGTRWKGVEENLLGRFLRPTLRYRCTVKVICEVWSGTWILEFTCAAPFRYFGIDTSVITACLAATVGVVRSASPPTSLTCYT